MVPILAEIEKGEQERDGQRIGLTICERNLVKGEKIERGRNPGTAGRRRMDTIVK